MRKLYSKIKDRKNIGILLLISVLLVSGISFGGTAYAADSGAGEVTFAGGSGTDTDPYIIETAEQLDAVRNNLKAAYKLNKDIEFTEADFTEDGAFYNGGEGWAPISNFSGIFDGNGHVIRNIVINSSTNYTGFFGSCYGAKIMNMGVENGSVSGHHYNVGGIVGYCYNAEIEKCYYAGTANGDYCIGGIVGECGGESAIRDCYNAASLTGSCAGGIAGSLARGEISSCYNIGNIKATYTAGEIAGTNEKGSITDCYYIEAQLPGVGSGTDTATACSPKEFALQATFAGFDFDTVWKIDGSREYRFPVLQGLPNDVTFGRTENFTEFAGGYGIKSSPYIITNMQQLNNVRNYPDASFKLADDIEFTSSDFASGGAFYNEGKGWEPIASFTGMFDGDGHVIKGLQCERQNDNYAGLFGYSSGTITGLGMVNGTVKGSTAGGICADNSGLISRCYNTCTVTGSAAGGIAGYNQRIIKDCYNSGEISGRGYTGGIVGNNNKYSRYLCEVINCYNIGKIGWCEYRGSIAGSNYNNAVITGCYYSNIGIKASYHSEDNAGATSLTDLRKQETYAEFDFNNTWTIAPGADYWLPTLQGVTNYAAAPKENTTDYAGGYGTYDSPYLITDVQQLDNIRKNLNASYRLENDITFKISDFSRKGGAFFNEGKLWEPVGTGDEAFYGNLDGNGYCISGILINRPDDSYCGLFSYNYGDIKNLQISYFAITGGNYSGGIAGYNKGNLSHCYNLDSVEISGTNSYGVLCGYNFGTVSKCFNTGDLTSEGSIGGIVYANGERYSSGGKIEMCYNSGNITAGSCAGGITVSGGRVINCYNSGNIIAGERANGIAYLYDGRTIVNCYNIGVVRSKYYTEYEGNISAYDSGSTPQDCYSLDTKYEYHNCDGNACTLNQMMKKETYKGFEFDSVWEFEENSAYKFPTLRDVKNYSVAPTENKTDFDGGYGTKSSPYIIKTKAQLNNIRKNLTACYKLDADISFISSDFEKGGEFYNDGKGWISIGNAKELFMGSFNGNGYTIDGLSINRTEESYAGLFGNAAGNIRNLKITNASIKGSGYVGGIAGYLTYGNISDCEVEGTVSIFDNDNSREGYAGGIVGKTFGDYYRKNYVSTIKNCTNRAKLVSDKALRCAKIGGIAGTSSCLEITGSQNYGTIQCNNRCGYAGGISGVGGKIDKCFNAGEIIGAANGEIIVGGIVGYDSDTTITKSYNIGTVTSGEIAGGILGSFESNDSGAVNNCYNAGRVSATTDKENEEGKYGSAGGIIGRYAYNIENCYNTGEITSTCGEAGGIAGSTYSETGCYIKQCYNIGNISCDSGSAGAIAGTNNLTISDCYYLDNMSKGVGSGTDTATSCTSEELQNQATYNSKTWDFELYCVWDISDTAVYRYPILDEVINPELQYTLSTEARQGMPKAPEEASYGNREITINAVIGQKYVCIPGTDEDISVIPAHDSSEWKAAASAALTFEGLEQGRTYKIYTYVPAAGNKNASYVSQPLVVTLNETGDLSGDGRVEASDALYLRRALAGWDGYKINFSAADINIDGKISADDVMALERHIAGWRGYEKLPVVKNADE